MDAGVPPVMDADTHRVFARVALELLERKTRLLEHIADIDRQTRPEHQGIVSAVRLALEKYADFLSVVLEDPQASGQKTKSAHAVLVHFATYFNLAHELLTFLPAPHVTPEMFRVIECSGFADPHLAAIGLGPAFNAYEFDFIDRTVPHIPPEEEFWNVVKNAPFFQMALADDAAPTSWAVLGHEIGHALDNRAKIIDSVAAANPAPPEWALGADIYNDVLTELWCDLVGAHILGAAPILAVVGMEYCLHVRRERPWHAKASGSKTRVHPPATWRLLAVKELLKASRVSVKMLDAEIQTYATLARVHGEEKAATLAPETEEYFDQCIRPVLPALVAAIPATLTKCPDFDRGMQRMRRRLRAELPIASQGLARYQLRKELAAYRAAPGVPQFKATARQFCESPTPLAVILNAGHLRRQELLCRAAAQGLSADDTEKVLADVAHNEALLVTSLVASGIHERLRVVLKLPKQVVPTPLPRAGSAHPSRSTNLLLSDIQILERIVADGDDLLFISPLVDGRQVGPASFDVRLGTEICFVQTMRSSEIDFSKDGKSAQRDVERYFVRKRVRPDETFVLHPGQFALATTLEYFRLPRDLAGRLEGRSTPARVGLQVHATAGFVDPGFEGTLTFELSNAGNVPLRVAPGYRLGQICFFGVNDVQVPYSGKDRPKYARSVGVRLPRFDLEPELQDVTAEQV